MECHSRNPSGRTLTVVLGIAMVASACLDSGTTTLQPAEESGSRILVEDGEGGHVSVNVTNETGAVIGHVLTDAGFGLPDARVTVWGARTGATTNATGWFEVLGVPPGKRVLRAEHPQFFPAESDVEVRAANVTKLTITLVPAEAEAGYRPHVHDYWAGRREVVILDDYFQWFRNAQPYPYGEAARIAAIGLFAAGNVCVSESSRSQAAGSSSPFYPEDGGIIYPGTNRVDVTISWTQTDYVGSERIGIAWRPPTGPGFNWSKTLRSGETLQIPVMPGEWDSGHQQFSLWKFHACLTGQDERNVAGSQNYVGRAFIGKFHAKMVIHRGGPLFVEPPHPRFWQNSSTLVIVNSTRTFSCTTPGDFWCAERPIFGRVMEDFAWAPPPDVIVPPGTKSLLVNISWKYGVGVPGKPLAVTFSSADMPPQEKSDLRKYQLLEAYDRQPAARFYVLELGPGQSDAYYQKLSNWAFAWGLEGGERDPSYVHECLCDLRIQLSVVAIRDSRPV